MREAISEALTSAQDKGDKTRMSILRLIKCAVKDRDVANREAGRDPVDKDDILNILLTMRRQRIESAQAYEESGRLELAEQERHEIEVIEEFLPAQLDESAMQEACKSAVEDIDAKGLRDVGRCMNALKQRFPGQMDFTKASTVVKGMLR
ncbi:GatB/YqeY domain-containing protein [Fulvimarina sp. 2208YS6-2-32]|uniref:GatB/YqeY domain-containing protein n=1 Tax=Fulvimarina uroteuthidis TaxID=3098149 RepID=A0ABU5I2R7_9HYPH|nr:GatB/YqeY domain-containing protein [Fulvimarina sp. 2208YS6-2-32]MDY8109666.1 GatB/YqeY domain-containing protein [Fulvimarina sp. 2208YS6-2-32]